MIDIFRNEYNDRYHFFIQFTKHVQRIRNTSHIQFEIKKIIHVIQSELSP